MIYSSLLLLQSSFWQDEPSSPSPPGFSSHPPSGAQPQGRRLWGLHISAWQVGQSCKNFPQSSTLLFWNVTSCKLNPTNFSYLSRNGHWSTSLFTIILLSLQVPCNTSQRRWSQSSKDWSSIQEVLQTTKAEGKQVFSKSDLYKHNLVKIYRFCYYLGGTADAATGNLGAMSKPLSWGMPRFFWNTLVFTWLFLTASLLQW